MKILLIDDDPNVLFALKLVLEALGYQVSAHTSPREALGKLASSAVTDLVLCDLKMPEMSGLQVLTQVRAQGIETPFVLMSGHATAAEVKEFQAKGGDDFLGKPFTPDQFRQTLARVKDRVKERKAV